MAEPEHSDAPHASSLGKVSRNFAALGLGEAVSRLVAFGAYIFLARTLGAAGYGVIAFATGVNLYLAKIADFSIDAVATSEIAKAPGQVAQLAATTISARLALTAVLAVLASALVLLTVSEPDRTVLTLYFLTLFPVAASTKWIHLGRDNAAPIGFLRICGELLFLASVVALVHRMDDLWKVPLCSLAGDSLAAVSLYLLLVRAGQGFGLRWDLTLALPLFQRALPLMAQMLLGLLLYNSDLIFLRFLRDSETVGLYSAAYTLLSFLGNLAAAYALSLLPALSQQGERSARESELYQTAVSQVYALAFPLTVGGTLLASGIIELGFGTGYAQAGRVLAVLIWTLPLGTTRHVPWAALIVRGEQRLLLRATVYAVAFSVLFNLLLIPAYGMIGAAVTTVLSEALVGVLSFYYASRLGLPLVSPLRLLRPTIGGLCMGGALLAFAGANTLVRFAIGAAGYLAVMALMGSIRLKGRLPVLDV